MKYACTLVIVIIALWAAFFAGCDSMEPGSFSMNLTWDDPPEQEVWVWLQVEERTDPMAPGVIIASASPAAYNFGSPLEVSLPSVPNGDNRVVVVEVREDNNAALAVLYYGVSDPFSLHPGMAVKIDVPMALQKPEAEKNEAETSLQFDGQTMDAVGPPQVALATVVSRSTGAVSVMLANDASFSAGMETLKLATGEGLQCTEEQDEELTWTTCEIDWDLSAGLPPLVDGTLTVYAKFIDRYGYESQVHKQSVMYDVTAPAVVTGSLSPPVARAGETVVISVTFHEPIAVDENGAQLVVNPDRQDGPQFEGPQRVGESNSYVWTALIPTVDKEDANEYTFSVAAHDALGNESGGQQLTDTEGQLLTLVLDAAPPTLVEEDTVQFSQELFGIVDDDEEVVPLTFDFVLQEALPGELGAEEGPCEGNCPVVSLGGKKLGQVLRKPALDNPAMEEMGFAYQYDVTGNDWGTVDKELELAIQWSDLAGNAMDVVLDQTVRFDFVYPEVTDCVLTPLTANALSTVVLNVTFSEALAVVPEVAELSGHPDVFGEPQVASGGLTYVWSAPATLFEADEISFGFAIQDVAGNSVVQALCNQTAQLDTKPPVVLEESVTTVPVVLTGAGEVVSAVGPGDKLLVSFSVQESNELTDIPEVLIHAGPKTLEPEMTLSVPDETDPSLVHYSFEMVFDSLLHADCQGTWPIEVTVADTSGNLVMMPQVGGDNLTIDMEPPTADCSLIPAPPEAGYGIGNKVTLIVSPFEELEPGYLPEIEDNISPPLELPLLAYEENTDYRFSGLVPSSSHEHSMELAVRLRDLVGNETPPDGSACAGPVTGKLDAALPSVPQATLKVADPVLTEPSGAYSVDTYFQLDLVVDGTQNMPVVFLGDGEMESLSLFPDVGPDGFSYWQFERTLDGSEGNGEQTVSLSGEDEAGNAYSIVVADAVGTFDFLPPTASCFAAPAFAGRGATITVTVAVFEALKEEPTMVSDLALVLEPQGQLANSYLYNFVVPDNGTFPSPWQYEVVVYDLAGNRNAGEFACSGGGEIDFEPPVVEGDQEGIYVSETHVKEGQQFFVAFSVPDADELAGDPTVKIGNRPLAQAPELYEADYVYAYTPSAVGDPSDEEGIWPVLIILTDKAGNQTSYSPATVTFDFTAPYLVEEPVVELSPPGGCPLDGVVAMGAGGSCELTISVDDVLASAPQLKLETPGMEPIWLDNIDPPSDYRTTFNYRFRDGEDGNLPPGGNYDLDLSIAYEDRAGNTGLWTAQVKVDMVAPEVPDTLTPGKIVYVRSPWGSDKTNGEKSFQLKGEPGAVTPGSTVVVYDNNILDEALEVSRTVADSQGAFGETAQGGQPFVLGKADREALFLVAVDGACNRSDVDGIENGVQPAEVKDVEWVATLGFKEAGDTSANWLVFEQRSWFSDRLFQSDGVEPGEPSVLGTAAGGEVETLGAGDWRERKRRTNRPGSLANYAMGYDSGRERIVLYGGTSSSNITGDTWEFDGSVWELRAPLDPESDGNPPPLTDTDLTYDSLRHKMVMFGGAKFGKNENKSDETWEWDGMSWARRVPADPEGDGNPVARWRHDQAYHQDTGKTILHGGYLTYGTYEQDTWQWDGKSWESIPSPSKGRLDHRMAYDPVRKRTLLFGGGGDGETWEWDGGKWLQVVPVDNLGDGNPEDRQGPGLAWDATSQRLLLFGGSGPDVYDDRDDLWAWDGSEWELLTTGPMSVRRNMRLASFPKFDAVFTFGGHDFGNSDGNNDECWQWKQGAWQQWEVYGEDEAPPPTVGHGWLYDPANEAAWHSAGYGTYGWNGKIRGWDGYRWFLAGDVPSGQHFAAAFDPGNQWAFYFGNWWSATGSFAWNGTNWFAVPTDDPEGDGEPAGHGSAGIALDHLRNRIVQFGGKDEECLDQTWEWNGASWQLVAPQDPEGDGNPSARTYHKMTWDPSRSAVMLLSGHDLQCGGAVNHNGVQWEWDGVSWAKVVPDDPEGDGSPDHSQHEDNYHKAYALATDTQRGKVIAVGRSNDEAGEDLWEWNGASWRLVVPADPELDGRPTPHEDHEMTYDSGRNVVMMQGGAKADTWNDELWEWDAGMDQRPGHVLLCPLAEAGLYGDDTVLDMGIRWVAGGAGYPDGIESSGVELLVWDGGTWTPIDAAEAMPQAPAELSWSTSEEALLSRLPATDSRYLGFAVAPQYANGFDWARVTSRYVELTISYRKQ